MGILEYASQHGHVTVQWQPGDEQSVQAARRTYDDLKKQGYEFYLVNEDGTPGDQLKRWNQKHERVIAVPGVKSKEDKAKGTRPKAMAGGPNEEVLVDLDLTLRF